MQPFFPDKLERVHAWLLNTFGSFLGQVQRGPGCVVAWRIQLGEAVAPVHWVEVHLPVDFPNAAPRLRVDERLVLALPHVEYGGFLCLRLDAASEAFEHDPAAVVELALSRFHNDFLALVRAPPEDDPFESEALSYWALLTGKYSKAARFKHLLSVDLPPCAFTWRACPGVGEEGGRAYYAADEEHAERYYRQYLRSGTRRRLEVIELSIPRPLTPRNWPTDIRALWQRIGAVSAEALERLERLSRRRSRKDRQREVLTAVVFRSPGMAQGYLIERRAMVPVRVERADRAWTLGRDANPRIAARAARHALVLGLGSLGSAVLELLQRSGVGRLTLVDPDVIEMANVGRHLLTARSLGHDKASELAGRVRDVCPDTEVDAQPMDAAQWLSKQKSLAGFDVLVDLTGEARIRRLFNCYRLRHGTEAPWVIGWLEPYCAAGHAAALAGSTDWFIDGEDPAEPRINSAHWPESAFTRLPGCGASFQSYTASSMSYVAGMVADAVLDALDDRIAQSEVRSWTRRLSYYAQHCPAAQLRPWRLSYGEDGDRVVLRPWATL